MKQLLANIGKAYSTFTKTKANKPPVTALAPESETIVNPISNPFKKRSNGKYIQ